MMRQMIAKGAIAFKLRLREPLICRCLVRELILGGMVLCYIFRLIAGQGGLEIQQYSLASIQVLDFPNRAVAFTAFRSEEWFDPRRIYFDQCSEVDTAFSNR